MHSAVDYIHQTVSKQSAGNSRQTVSRNSQQTSLQMRLSSNSVHATIMCNKQLTGYTAATNATICHYHRHSFPPPPLCAVAADTAAEPDRARHCRHSLLLLVLLPLNRRTCCCCHRRRERACVCVHVCERECVNVCVSPDNRQGL